jgi:hypothetical protein
MMNRDRLKKRQKTKKKLKKKKSNAFILLELVVWCGVLIALAAGGCVLITRGERWCVHLSARQLLSSAVLMSECARSARSEATIKLFLDEWWYVGCVAEKQWRISLLPGVAFGAPAGTKGPPSRPMHQITQAVVGGAWGGRSVVFTWDRHGNHTPGSIYLKGRFSDACYAVTFPRAAYAAPRLYMLVDGKWRLL